MAELKTEQRDDLSDRQFAYISKDGQRHLPIHDAAHVRNAAARFDQTNFESAAAKKEAAKHIQAAAKKYGIELGTDDAVMQAAR